MLLADKRKHKSLKEWCRSTRWISCRNLRYSNPRCFDRTKNVCLFIEWSTKITQLSVWHILEMLYFAYCMDKYAKSEEESLIKICVSFVEINTDTECTGGRAGLMRRIANPVYVRICVSWGRSPVRTLNRTIV